MFTHKISGIRLRRRTPFQLFALTLAIVLAAIGSSQFANAAPDNQGDEFILGFMENLGGSGETTQLFITGPVATSATVEVPGLFGPTVFPVTPGTITSVMLPLSVRATGSGTTQMRGVLVTAPAEITVYGLNQRSATTDAFLGLPTDILGTDYIVPAFENRSTGLVSEVMIVGTADGTTVTITPNAATSGGSDVGAIAAGASASVTIDRLEVLQIQASGSGGPDLTGSEITSDAPIAVYGGHLCADVPRTSSACDHLVEQIPPTTTWGTSFLTAPLATRTGGDLFRVTSAADDNVVSLDGAPVATIDRGEFHQLDLASGTYHEIDTSKAAILTQYSKGTTTDGVTSDPMMMMIPPTGQFASNYTVSTPSATPRAFANWINIVAPTASLAGLSLDGAPITTTWTPIGGSGFSGTQVPVAVGAHTVVHTSPIVPFGVYSYGWANADSYGYPGGLRLAPLGDACETTSMVPGDGVDNECDGRIDEELPNGVDDDGDGLIDEDLAVACIPGGFPNVPGDGIDNDCDGRIDEETDDGIDNDGDTDIDEDLGLGVLPSCSTQFSYIPDASTFTADLTPVVGGDAGTFGFDAVLTNTGGFDLTDLETTIAILTNGNLLLSADNGAGAVGDTYTLPNIGAYADGVLSPGESVAMPHLVGLAAFIRFDFFVDLNCTVGEVDPN